MAATKKISELVTASPLTGVELVPIVQGGQTVQSNADAFKAFSVAGVEAEVSTLDIRVTSLESNVAAVSVLTTFTQTGTGAVLRSGQDKMRDIINAKDFGVVGDGIADDTDALRRAVTAAAGRTLVLTGTFLVKGTVTVASSNTRIIGDGLAKIVADKGTAWTTGQPVLDIRGPGPATGTTLSADISATSTTFTVASAANFAPGTFMQISSNAEYWSGIAGDPGFQTISKRELNCVRSVSGNVITPEWGFADTYSVSGFTVTITPYTFLENVKVEGVEFYGTGNGNSNTTTNMPMAVHTIYVNDFTMTRCRIENFQNTAAELEFTNNARITNNEIAGRDLTDSSNLPTVSDWFYGVVFNGSTNWVFSNNTCQYLRRAVDAGGTSGFPISRHGVVANNTAISCGNGYGTHFCEDVVFVGNVATDCESGIYFRGKNGYFIGNTFESTAATTSAAGILIGGDDGTNYAENPSAGRIVIANNILRTRVQGIRIRVDVDSVSITGNTIYGGNSYGIAFDGKRTKDVIIANNHLDLTTRTASRGGIAVLNTASRIVELRNITINGNRIKNGEEQIRIEGPIARTNAATNIIIKENTFDNAVSIARVLRLTDGYFGKNIVFRDNLVGAPVTVGNTFLDVNSYFFEQTPDLGDNAFWDYNQQVIGFAPPGGGGVPPTLQTRLSAVVGQRFINSAPTPGGYMGWVCTSAGTYGNLATVNGGVAITGDITSGTDQLTVSSNTNNALYIGAFITIAGAGVAGAALTTQVTAVSGLTITVANNASTTVVGAAITYTVPVLKGFGLIET